MSTNFLMRLLFTLLIGCLSVVVHAQGQENIRSGRSLSKIRQMIMGDQSRDYFPVYSQPSFINGHRNRHPALNFVPLSTDPVIFPNIPYYHVQPLKSVKENKIEGVKNNLNMTKLIRRLKKARKNNGTLKLKANTGQAITSFNNNYYPPAPSPILDWNYQPSPVDLAPPLAYGQVPPPTSKYTHSHSPQFQPILALPLDQVPVDGATILEPQTVSNESTGRPMVIVLQPMTSYQEIPLRPPQGNIFGKLTSYLRLFMPRMNWRSGPPSLPQFSQPIVMQDFSGGRRAFS